MAIDTTAATNALWNSYSNFSALGDRKANRRAGMALAEGDYTAASQALGDAGNLSGVLTVNNAQRSLEDREAQEKRDWIGRAATSLMQVPEAQRQQVYQEQLRPTLEAMGLGADVIDQIDRSPKADTNLRSLIAAIGGEVSAPYANDVAGRDGARLRPDPITGAYTEVYRPEFDPRAGASPGYMWTDETRTRQTFIPGGAADPSVAGSLAASRRAPPRARSSGGGSSGGRSSAPAAPARKPWERY